MIGDCTYSFVIPVLDEEDVLPELLPRLAAVAEDLDGESEFLFVDDGSTDQTRQLILDARERDARVKLLSFSRNFGHQFAISAGIDAARGDAVVIMDADLQDPPELVPEMAHQWREGFDVVSAVRAGREGEPRLKVALARLFYRVIDRASAVDLPVDIGDFRLIDRRVADVIRAMREPGRYLRGMFAWAGFRQTTVSFSRPARAAGEPKYSLHRSLKLGVDGLLAFSTVPLRVALALGLLVSAIAFAAGIAAIALKIAGVYSLPGIVTVVVLISMFSGMQLIMLGAVGAYVGRIYEQGKRRPLYIVAEAHGLPAHPERDHETQKSP